MDTFVGYRASKRPTKEERAVLLEARRALYRAELEIARELYPIGVVATCDTETDTVWGRVTGYTPAADGRVLVVLDGSGPKGIDSGWASYLNELR